MYHYNRYINKLHIPGSIIVLCHRVLERRRRRIVVSPKKKNSLFSLTRLQVLVLVRLLVW